MTTAYTSLLGLALPVQGELSGTWGDTVNNYITQYTDASIAGTQTISGSQTAVTLSVTNGSALSQAGSGATGSSQYAVINCTGNPGGLLTITAPASSKEYLIINATSTNQSVKIVGAGPTTGVTIVATEKAIVAWNGSDFVKVASSLVSQLSGTLGVANGGTGLTSGTSGGVLAFTASGTIASSGALTANALVIGGGAGAAPSTTTTGTGVVTALGVNTGSAGAFVVNGGALGTPSSGTLSACTVDGTTSVGFLSIPQNSQSAAYTTVLADAGKCIFHPSTDANARTFTIAANASVAYPIGTVIQFVNMTSQAVTIAITSDTMYLAGTGTTGSRTLGQYGVANAMKIGTTTWIITGSALT